MKFRSATEAARGLAELERRRQVSPLAHADLWDREEPRTSQRRALALSALPNVLLSLLIGGNRTGKSEALAQWAVVQAAGRDASVESPAGPVYWVRRWLARNGYPDTMVQPTPGRVWVASPTFAAAVEQIRPKIRRWCPGSTKYSRWDDKAGEGEATLPNGGCLVGKAYKQYDQNPDSWEGAAIRALALDEQPNCRANLTAGLARLVDQGGRAVGAVTPLRGKGDWFYVDLLRSPPEWARVAYLYGADNPHIPQAWREMMLAATPPWQRASRDRGEVTSPEGAIYPFDRGVHEVQPFEIPAPWTRYVGVDWGARAPHVVWAAEVAGLFDLPDGRQLLTGDLVVYRELAPRRTTQEPGITDRRLIQWARDAEAGQESLISATLYRVADSESPGAIEEAAEQGWFVAPAQKGAGSVAEGISIVESLLQTQDPITIEPQRARLYIIQGAAPVLTEELEGMKWAEVKEGQAPKPDPSCPDHGPDALRYIVQFRESMGYI